LSRYTHIILYAFIAGAVCFLTVPAVPGASRGLPPAGLKCYLVQMHIHAHSNHNGSDLPASMEWHSYQAQKYGFDVVWWSDHSEIFDEYTDIRVSLGRAEYDRENQTVMLPSRRMGRRLSRFDVAGPEEGFAVSTQGPNLRMRLVSSHGGKFDSASLTPASGRGLVKSLDWCRPVSSGLRLEVVMSMNDLDDDSFLRFKFKLAAHPEGRHRLIYNIVRGEGSPPEVVGDTLVVQSVGIGGFPARLAFDLERAAAYLTDGYDNTLSSVTMEFGVRNGATVEVAVDSLNLISTRPSGENQYRVVEKLARLYESRYGVTQYIGVEAGGVHTPERPHMNAFFPEKAETFENTVIGPGVDRSVWTSRVHDRGGLVSLNHPFGAALTPEIREQPEGADVPTLRQLAATAAPMPVDELWRVAAPIIETGGLGCDVLEVGYLFRGNGSLNDHLRLWDLVLAHGVRLVGTGVTDSHGGVWGPDMLPNSFASWIWAKDKSRESLLAAVKAGRVCFGDPFLWEGRFAFGVEEAFMGDTLHVEPGKDVHCWILMDPWEDGMEVRFVHVKIESRRQPRIIDQGSLDSPGDGFNVHVEDPGFVRVEVYGRDGDPIVFSNPVWLIPG
jgi:hypothetical protein